MWPMLVRAREEIRHRDDETAGVARQIRRARQRPLRATWPHPAIGRPTRRQPTPYARGAPAPSIPPFGSFAAVSSASTLPCRNLPRACLPLGNKLLVPAAAPESPGYRSTLRHRPRRSSSGNSRNQPSRNAPVARSSCSIPRTRRAFHRRRLLRNQLFGKIEVKIGNQHGVDS